MNFQSLLGHLFLWLTTEMLQHINIFIPPPNPVVSGPQKHWACLPATGFNTVLHPSQSLYYLVKISRDQEVGEGKESRPLLLGHVGKFHKWHLFCCSHSCSLGMKWLSSIISKGPVFAKKRLIQLQSSPFPSMEWNLCFLKYELTLGKIALLPSCWHTFAAKLARFIARLHRCLIGKKMPLVEFIL